MATGIPKSNGIHERHPTRSAKPEGSSVSLTYAGKKPLADILKIPPSKIEIAWQPPYGSTRNRLYFGENLSVLATLLQDTQVRQKVRLIYIDPPYATRSVFQSRKQADAYHDLLEGPTYLEFLRERLILLHELLADDGSIYLHLDENMAFQVKVLMDEIFGPSCYRNWLTRKKCNPKNYTRKTYGNVADYILFYTKADNYVWHRPVEAWTDQRAAREYNYIEPGTGRRYKKVPVHAPGIRNGETGKLWRGVSPPPGKHWQYPPRVLDEMDARGEIYWSATGNPRRKIYLDQSTGVPVQDIWMDFRDAHNQNIRITGYPTEKNPALLARIIAASSNPGDLVLDCFCGSGTTLEAAHRLGRHWIGVDDSAEAIRTTLARFAKGVEPMGDFVRRMEREDEAAAQEEMLPLFDSKPIAGQLREVAEIHEPITEFALHVVTGLNANEILANWHVPCGAGLKSHGSAGSSAEPLAAREESGTEVDAKTIARRPIRYVNSKSSEHSKREPNGSKRSAQRRRKT